MEDNVLKTKEACLQGIQKAVVNESLFWFGTDYDVICPNGTSFYEIQCTDLNVDRKPRSLSSQLFWNGTFNTSKIQQFLHVNYTSAPGT